jgi:hypothetical protein
MTRRRHFEQCAQHVGHGEAKVKRGDLDPAAQRWRLVDRQPRGARGVRRAGG